MGTVQCRPGRHRDEPGGRGHGARLHADAAEVMCALRSPQRPSGRSLPEQASAPRGAAATDAGVTIVEMLAAIFILGVGVMGVATLMVASARTAAVAEAERDASVLATGEIEIIRSLDYELIGIDPSADGYAPTVEDRPTVTEPADNRIRPVETIEIGTRSFKVERSVTWASVGDNREAYKIVRVVVSWESNVGVRSHTVQTGLHEGLFDA